MRPETERILRAHGWCPERRYDSTRAEEVLRANGYELTRSALEFIRSFGGLCIGFVRKPGGEEDSLELDPVRAASSVIPKWIAECEVRTRSRLVSVGRVYTGHMVVLIDEQGRLFGCFEGVLISFGHTMESALDAIVLDADSEMIPW